MSSGGPKTKDTITGKMDELIAQQTRCRFKLQRRERPSEPRMEPTILDKTDTEMRDILIQLNAQNKKQQDQIKATNLVMEEVLAHQTIIGNKLHVGNKLHATELL